MPLETGSYLSDLVVTNPAHTDSLSQTDSHIRLIKAALKNTFPNITGAVSMTDAQLSQLMTRLCLVAEPSLGFERSAAGVLRVVGGVLRGNGAIPPGAICDFAGPSAPTGWVACDGGGLSTAAAPELFTEIGYTWGGSGGTFYVPNLQSRFRRHRDNNPTYAGGVGNMQGPQNLSHAHGASGSAAANGDHAHIGTTNPASGQPHNHNYFVAANTNATLGTGGALIGGIWAGTAQLQTGSENQSLVHDHTFGTNTVGNHSHAISVSIAADGGIEARPYCATVLTCIKL